MNLRLLEYNSRFPADTLAEADRGGSSEGSSFRGTGGETRCFKGRFLDVLCHWGERGMIGFYREGDTDSGIEDIGVMRGRLEGRYFGSWDRLFWEFDGSCYGDGRLGQSSY